MNNKKGNMAVKNNLKMYFFLANKAKTPDEDTFTWNTRFKVNYPMMSEIQNCSFKDGVGQWQDMSFECFLERHFCGRSDQDTQFKSIWL